MDFASGDSCGDVPFTDRPRLSMGYTILLGPLAEEEVGTTQV